VFARTWNEAKKFFFFICGCKNTKILMRGAGKVCPGFFGDHANPFPPTTEKDWRGLQIEIRPTNEEEAKTPKHRSLT
jgi:hypothetical protein